MKSTDHVTGGSNWTAADFFRDCVHAIMQRIIGWMPLKRKMRKWDDVTQLCEKRAKMNNRVSGFSCQKSSSIIASKEGIQKTHCITLFAVSLKDVWFY